jgi:enoyl-CoA hydratase/carnithine racemase
VALSRNIGRKRAAEMLFTGEFIDATQALEWGLLNRIAAPERLMETARELAEALKAKPAEALATGKALYYRQLEAPLAQAYADATCVIAADMEGAIAKEGVDAFLAKRPPRWPG